MPMIFHPLTYRFAGIFLCVSFWANTTWSQDVKPNSASIIIEHIAELENKRDPKCYATASRLEDFMYGTPLTDEARMLKFDIQKSIIRDIRVMSSELSSKNQEDSISQHLVQQVINKIGRLERTPEGDRIYRTTNNEIRISATDFRQYASVAYILRVLLSLEQDLLFSGEPMPLPLTQSAIDALNEYMNVMTLCVLKIADQTARNQNDSDIDVSQLVNAWLGLLQGQFDYQIENIYYVEPKAIEADDNQVLHDIIDQKMASYEVYNELNSKVFLRNIQVYFARQKWPADGDASNELKNLFLEGLIGFTREFLLLAQTVSEDADRKLIRQSDADVALDQIMPFEVNQFEDVLYYPNDKTNRVRIEAYDLDAFRDSGIHWKVLEFALDDLEKSDLNVIDPQAAELIVEGIAQMGVLMLRLAGTFSRESGHSTLQNSDLEKAWVHLQEVINHYHLHSETEKEKNRLGVIDSLSVGFPFSDVTISSGIEFTHRSADWLSRMIRGFVYKEDENLARLSIPPAFGGAGVGAEDIDNDGDTDILILGGAGNQLLINIGNGQFEISNASDDLTVWIDSLQSFAEPRQPIIADLDNDGLQDIVITYVNENHRVYKNLGNGKFEDVSDKARLGGKNKVGGPATVFDYDQDGLLDLYIGYFGNYVNGELPTISRYNQNGEPNVLFRNLGEFRFEAVTYLASNDDTDNGWSQAIGHSDINRDGWQDIIVGNDFGVNRYYINKGDGTFVDSSRELGTDKPSYTMNVGIADLNSDGYPDFYISNIVVMQKDEKYVSPNEHTTMKFDPEKMANIRTVEANDLFISQVDKTNPITYIRSEEIGRGYSSTGWSWDADFFDYDLDGDDDLYCLNGMNDFRVYSSENPFYYSDEDSSAHIQYAESTRERNVFFHNENNHLINKAEELGLDLYSNARSAAYFDLENDGDLDIVINNYHDRATVMRNNQNGGGHYLKIKLVGDPDQGVNRDAIGSTIQVRQNGKSNWREVHSTTGYLSVHPKEQHFGFGNEKKINITIRWPNGRIVDFDNIPVNHRFEVHYPDQISMKDDVPLPR